MNEKNGYVQRTLINKNAYPWIMLYLSLRPEGRWAVRWFLTGLQAIIK